MTSIIVNTAVGTKNPLIVEKKTSRKIAVAIGGTQGPPGPKGDAGQSGAAGSGLQIVQGTPLGTWTLVHNFGRLPAVEVYNQAGELVIADVFSTPTTTVVSFAVPTSGVAVLT